MEAAEMEKKQQEGNEEKKEANLEGLPVDTSPYTQYTDLADYKKQAYGTEGHIEPNPNPSRGAAASTDAPTTAAQPSSTDAKPAVS